MLGCCAGVLSALFGVGGGLIFVPTLIFLGGDSARSAVATSLAAMVPVILSARGGRRATGPCAGATPT